MASSAGVGRRVADLPYSAGFVAFPCGGEGGGHVVAIGAEGAPGLNVVDEPAARHDYE